MAEENASTRWVTASWTKGEQVHADTVPVLVQVYDGPGSAILSIEIADAEDSEFKHSWVTAIGGTTLKCTTRRGEESLTAEVDLEPLMRAMATFNAEAFDKKGGAADGNANR